MEFSMKLHTKKQEFRDAVQQTAKMFKISEVLIEKDYWITYVLKRLSDSNFRDDVVFKGGTSLNKAFGIVKRFSEDIDLALCNQKSLSGNQIKTKLKKIEKYLTADPLKVDDKYAESKGSKIRKTGHIYPRTLSHYGDFQDVSAGDTLVLELNAFANSETNLIKSIETYIAEYLRGFDEKLIVEYGLKSFQVKVISVDKTFVEKVLCLARISIEENGFSEQIERKNETFL